MWTYLPYGPFESLSSYAAWLDGVAGRADPLFFAIVNREDQAGGVAAWQRVDPDNGSIEVGLPSGGTAARVRL